MTETRTGTVSSADGTEIGYREVGSGPPLIVVHGTMSSGYNQFELAEVLARDFTVVLPDRRGRGLSGPYASGSFLEQEVADVRAMLAETGARDVFGVSVGAIIALEVALTSPFDRLAIFEPPFFVNGPAPTKWLARFDREVAKGRVESAMVTGMKASGLGPPMLNVIPHRLLTRMVKLMLRREEKSGPSDYVPMRKLAPLLHQDGHIIAAANERLERFAAMRADILLAGARARATCATRSAASNRSSRARSVRS